jgi:hypothetical protein
MIERQIEAPVMPGDDDGLFRPVSLSPSEDDEGPYIEPGGLVDIATRELGGLVTSVESLPETEP